MTYDNPNAPGAADPNATTSAPPPAGRGGTGDVGYQPQPGGQETNKLAIASLVVSILSLACCCFGNFGPVLGIVVAIVGAVMGGVAEKQIRENPAQTGKGIAMAGRIVGIVASILLTLLLLAGLAGLAWLGSDAGQQFMLDQGLDPQTGQPVETPVETPVEDVDGFGGDAGDLNGDLDDAIDGDGLGGTEVEPNE